MKEKQLGKYKQNIYFCKETDKSRKSNKQRNITKIRSKDRKHNRKYTGKKCRYVIRKRKEERYRNCKNLHKDRRTKRTIEILS